jgi:hypothetical protein
MAKADVWQRIRDNLQHLSGDASIQPANLAAAIGLPLSQVNPSLAAAKKRGDVETLPDGSVRLSPITRDGKPEDIAPPTWLKAPLVILNRAISQVPATKYALGVAGIAAAAAIAYLLLMNFQSWIVWAIAGLVILVGFIFMVLLFIFARLIESKDPAIHRAGLVLMWFVLCLVIVWCVLLTTSVILKWPRDITDYFPFSRDWRAAPPGDSRVGEPEVTTEKIKKPSKGARVPPD